MKKILKIPIDSNRIFGLDIVRALAILFVLLTHSGNFVPRQLSPFYRMFIYDGVGVFFVLSGFLIGGILIKQAERFKFNFRSLLYFWVKRWSRTLPNYYLFLILLIANDFFTSDSFRFQDYLRYFIFSQNLFSSPPNFFFHAWSLSVEEWFYLIIPLLLLLICQIFPLKFKYNFLIVIFSIVLIVTVLRDQKINFVYNWDSFKNTVYGVVYRVDAIMYGMFGAFLHYYYPKFWCRYKAIFLSIAVVLFITHLVLQEIIPKNNFHFRAFLFSLTSVTVLLSLPYFSNLKKSSSVLLKPITYISLISYSLYLSNSIIVKKIEYFINWDYIILYCNNQLQIPISWSFALLFNYVLSWLMTFVISIVLYKYFEIPSTNYLRKKIKISLSKKEF